MSMSKQFAEWPAWRFGPGGEARIFQENEPVPAGWVDHPSKVVEPVKVKRAVKEKKLSATEQARAEARAEGLSVLREAGVDISQDASDEELSAALDALEE